MSVRKLSQSHWRVMVAVLLLGGLIKPPQAAAQAEELAIAGAIKEAYDAYKDMESVLTSDDPSEQDQIADRVTALEHDYKQVQKEIDALTELMKQNMRVERQDSFIKTLTDIEAVRAVADTAADQIAEWKYRGKKDVFLLNEALDHSLTAANTMRESTAFFLRPGDGESDMVFDYRSALPAYLYVLTVRRAVLFLAQPDFRTDPVIQNELSKQVARLDEILAAIDAPIQCDQSGSLPPDAAGYYDICSFCSDPITGKTSAIDGEYPRPLSPHCEDPLYGSAQDYTDGLGFFAFYDRYRTQEKVGYVDLRKLRDLVEADTHSSGTTEIFHHYKALIGYGGLCLTSPGLVMEPCDGSPAQEWQRDSNGALRSLDRCLEVDHFFTSNGAKLRLDDCSSAPGERWTLTTAGDVRGIGGKCLDVKDMSTAAGTPVQMYDCWGGPNQQWSLAAPPGPSITAIDPSSGPIAGGSYVHITGTGFDPAATAGNNMQAFFGDVASDYVSCEDSTRCTVRSPAVASPGPAYISVKVSGIFSTETALFTYHAHPALTGIDRYWSTSSIGISLDGYAPEGGTTVALGSSDPAAVGIPSSVTVPAGSSGTSFPVQLLPTPTAETVTVTASYEAVALSTSFDVAAWPPLSINLGAADFLDAGASSTASVSLNTVAPAGGAVVALVSSDPSAIPVPSSVTVPAGQKTATFTVTNYYSGVPKRVTISAAYNGLAASSGLFVPEEPTCRPRQCPKGFYWDPDSCACLRGLPE
jgi:hypothetical protein